MQHEFYSGGEPSVSWWQQIPCFRSSVYLLCTASWMEHWKAPKDWDDRRN